MIFSMPPKSGDLAQVSNWRLIAILQILYKLFARMLYHRFSPILFDHQSRDQMGFTPGKRIEETLMIAECIASYNIEFNLLVWFVSLDLRSAFDRVDHAAFFDALYQCNLPMGYIAFLQRLYASQRGSVNESQEFVIDRCVKQGDVLSPVLFNCILDVALKK